MRIAIIMLNGGRGSGVVARQHAHELLRLGHQVVFMHPRMDDGVPGAQNIDIVLPPPLTPVHEYLPGAKGQRAVSSMKATEALAYLPAYVSALDKVIDDTDLVIAHHGNLSAIAAAEVSRSRSVPYALFLHGTGIEPRLHGGYDDAVWSRIEDAVRGAAGIIVTTDYVRDELVLPLFDVPPDRFLVLPCGVYLDEFKPGATGDVRKRYDLPEQYVISPGAITRLKGTPNVVDATKHYADLAPTIFIGDGDLRRHLEEQIGDRGRFLGFVPTEDKAALINAASILVGAPEKQEHFGIIYIEAMAAGTVPVAYRGGGVDSIITESTGVLADRDPAALGQAIRGLLEDGDRRSIMAASARRRAEETFAAPVLGEHLATWLELTACS